MNCLVCDLLRWLLPTHQLCGWSQVGANPVPSLEPFGATARTTGRASFSSSVLLIARKIDILTDIDRETDKGTHNEPAHKPSETESTVLYALDKC